MTQSLYGFIRDFNFGQAPRHTRELVECSLLDIIGVAAGARGTHTSEIVRRYALDHHLVTEQASRLLFDGREVSPQGAAWAGGFSIDSLDGHEGHFKSKGHAGATVVPAILALVDACGDRGQAVSGEELLTLLSIGYETALRAGSALMATAADYHASGAFSGLGVVCAGARMLDLDEVAFRHALGIAEYFAPRCPMMRVIDHPTMLRDAHGAGAGNGIQALFLAQAGMTGAPADLVENAAVAPYWDSLGQAWEIDTQYFKPWPVCRWAQPALTAMSMLLETHEDITRAAIDSIRVETFHESMRLQGHAPANADEAQYALAFPLAALVARGQLGPREVTGEAIHAADIAALSRRIEIVEADDLSAQFPERILSRVSVHLKDGRRFDSPTMPAKGDPETALSPAEFRSKFRLLCETNMGHERCRAIERAVLQLKDSRDCTALFDLLFAR